MLLEIGRIDKAHGVAGEVVVTLVTDRIERLDPGSVLRANEQELTVVKSRPHQHRFIVRFDVINSREQVDPWRGAVLYAEPIDDPDVLWIHELIGKDVCDTAGNTLGNVVEIQENPASDLLVLEDETLIPLTFFVEYDSDGNIVIDPPAGLLPEAEPSAETESGNESGAVAGSSGTEKN